MVRAVCLCIVLLSPANAIAASEQVQNTLQLTVRPEAKLQALVADERSVRADVSVRLNAGSTASLLRHDVGNANAARVFQTNRSGNYAILLPVQRGREIRLILRLD